MTPETKFSPGRVYFKVFCEARDSSFRKLDGFFTVDFLELSFREIFHIIMDASIEKILNNDWHIRHIQIEHKAYESEE